ncbi:MAG: TonB-dependent receptor [Novosphingobium sp.]|nr:TonB-dependent receptor [Novosphingobium sp.]
MKAKSRATSLGFSAKLDWHSPAIEQHREGIIVKSKASLFIGSLASIMLHPCLAHAQEQSAAQEEPGSQNSQTEASATAQTPDIVVTGSRVARNGGNSPSPLTLVSGADLNKVAPSTIVEALRQLPQFSGSITKTSGSHQVPQQGIHGDFVNLHGIGAVRTLVLQDGRRFSPTTYYGLVDTSIIPQLLVSRVEVVTAGASAAYGSDAVSGVVNFILDRKFEGLKGVAQGGISSRGDNENYRVGLAYGTAIGERFNLVGSIERYQTWGLPTLNRPRYATQSRPVGSVPGGGTPGSLTNPLVDGRDLGNSSTGTFGGLITTGPFADQTFTQPGVFGPVNKGTPTGTTGFFVGSGYAHAVPFDVALPATSNTGFLRLNYEASPSLTAFVQFNGAMNKFAYGQNTGGRLSSNVNGVSFFADNAFLPAAMAARLAADRVQSFSLERSFIDNPANAKGTEEKLRYYNVATGFEGKFGQFRWDLTYQHSWARDRGAKVDYRTDRLAAATDAVRDPAGNIVCRVTLNPDPAVQARFAGCVPLNVFGVGAPSAAGLAYVTDFTRFQAINTFNQVAATISGELLQLPAGALLAAVGAEYRDFSLDLTSNADPRFPVSTTGLRNLRADALPFTISNVATAKGKENVKEVFGEVVLPVFRDQPFARKLELNAAARRTDYSISGAVTTWKVGSFWDPLDGVRFRATRSRDIRAPTLYDLFNNGQVVNSSFIDPHVNRLVAAKRITKGNPDLTPEFSNSLSLGVVLQPKAMPGFLLSVDYYDVNLKDAIQAIPADIAARNCEASNGTSPLCALIIRPLPFSDRTPANAATTTISSPTNIAGVRTSGLDVELGYRHGLGAGELSTRIFATYVHKYRIQDTPVTSPIDLAGRTEGDISSIGAVIPKFRGSLQVNYATDHWNITAQERMIGRLKRGGINIWAEPDIPAYFYTDLTLAYKLGAPDRGREIFLTTNNLFDKQPPFVANGPSAGGPFQSITTVYDVVGRTFTAGVRFRF